MSATLLIIGAVVAVLASAALRHTLLSPIKGIPGPLLAKFTNLWRLFNIWEGRADVTQLNLHRRYGPAVRLGPNCVSLNDPDLVKTIYSAKEKWVKSDFYAGNDIAIGRGYVMSTTFSTRNEQWHTMMIKPVSRLYTMTSVLRFEYLVDDTIQKFMNKLQQGFVARQNPCAIDKWLHYFAWDVIGHITFSRDLGFMDTQSDIDSLINTGERAVDYFALVGQIPFLDKIFDKNPVYRIGPPSFGSAAAYAAKLLSERRSGADEHRPRGQEDFLDLFLELAEQDPEVDDARIVTYLVNNVIAGSDTTAIELRAIVYYLAKDKDSMRRLQAEVDGAKNDDKPIQWKDASRMPYLDAVIRESTRLHPAVGLPLERVVPSSFRIKDGRTIPQGTIVGINPKVIHRDEGVFGAEPDSFRPERWLQYESESEGNYEKRVSKMKETDLTFGHGKRACSGRYVATMEIYKLIATLYANFDVYLVDARKEWKVKNSWFVRQWDMDCEIVARHVK